MTEKEFLAEVQELLQTDEVLSMDTHLPSLADWDSLSVMAMMAFLERNFGAKTTMADYKNIKDLSEIVKMANITL